MQTARRATDPMKILTRREMAAVLTDLHRKAERSRNTRMNLIFIASTSPWILSRRIRGVVVVSSQVG